ncbi:MAG: sucrose phosphorylase [Pseudomonadales bacterium]
MLHTVQLMAYADRLGGDLAGFKKLLDSELSDLFGGVHILPFFDPIDGEDAGFDPSDHCGVDPKLGEWKDIKRIAESHPVMADLIVNHISSDSAQFSDVRKHGENSAWWPLFLKKSDVFPEPVIDDEVARIFRPRPGRPFTTMQLDNGKRYEFWTTFSHQQIDINVESDAGQRYLNSILDTFAAAGIREIRLDAAGYAIKRRGTRCFMLPETFEFIADIASLAASQGIESLVEIHSHYQTQIEIANRVGRVYDFALPPLVLHTLYTADSLPIKNWLGVSPRNCVTVLDTHDGIGIMDVAREGNKPGLLSDDDVDALVERIHTETNGQSRAASGHAASNLDIYQVNSTFYDALGRSDSAYLIARAIQFFSPGTPQVYYVGLLAGHNDMALVEKTNVGRDINRHRYTNKEIRDAINLPVVQSLFELIRLRNSSPAFSGDFSLPECAENELRMRWNGAQDCIELRVKLDSLTADIIEHSDGQKIKYLLADELIKVL